MTLRSVFIANRGEIAVRIIRACNELGIRTVQAYSDADADSLAVILADDAVNIGPGPAAKSYLDIETVVTAAHNSGADAVHPGYGFLAENGDFADAVVAAGMTFVGPDGASIRLLGDKVAARKIAAEAGVPTVPGSVGRVADIDAARANGFSNSRIILRHMVPNVMAPFLIMLTAFVGQAILLEASLSFLCLGVQEPVPAWGLMLKNAQEYIRSEPWIAIWPGIAITLGVFGFNLFGDALRDALDPRLRSAQ